MDSLSQKQKAFCDYYLECGNATEAYKKAGYKNFKSAGVEANKTLKNPKVKAYIDERLKELESKRIANSQEVLEYLTRVMRGEEKDQFDLDAAITDRTKAAELLGKRYRLFVDRTEHTGNMNINIVDDIK